MFSPSPSSSSPLPAFTSSTASSPSSSSSSCLPDFFAAVFFAAVFFAAVFLATVFLAAVFFAGAATAASSATTSALSAAGAADAATVRVTAVLAATVLVAVRLTGLFAATLLRARLGDSAALTISVTPSSSRIWLRLRRTFFHWVGGIWSASKARRTSSCGDLPISLSPLDERHHRLGLGDLRRERTGCAGRHEQPLGTMETASGPALERAGTDDHAAGDVADGAGLASELHSALCGCCIPSAAVTS